MYPDDNAGGAAEQAAPMGAKIGMNLEGLIPLILILVIVFFLAAKFDIINGSTPVVGVLASIAGSQESTTVLLIGSSSPETLQVLYEMGDLIKLVQRDAASLDRNPKEVLANYGVIILDQSEQTDKAVSRKLGEALEEYVKKGGKLITVLDSGIYQPGAFDAVGWDATIGDIVPVNCDRIYQGEPTCMMRLNVRGKVYREIEDHKIMEGIEEFPIMPGQYANFQTFDVGLEGTEIAYMKDESGPGKTFPAIVEKKLIVGKSLYFNYNPGYTPRILQQTIYYLTGR
ncbi:MAG: hypothetical protein JW703_03825 [Candidatus Diapherotrites archaeon]|nr:hypothetical protein [Candidatus Diapherotrites archaeon]